MQSEKFLLCFLHCFSLSEVSDYRIVNREEDTDEERVLPCLNAILSLNRPMGHICKKIHHLWRFTLKSAINLLVEL